MAANSMSTKYNLQPIVLMGINRSIREEALMTLKTRGTHAIAFFTPTLRLNTPEFKSPPREAHSLVENTSTHIRIRFGDHTMYPSHPVSRHLQSAMFEIEYFYCDPYNDSPLQVMDVSLKCNEPRYQPDKERSLAIAKKTLPIIQNMAELHVVPVHTILILWMSEPESEDFRILEKLPQALHGEVRKALENFLGSVAEEEG